MRYLSDDLPPRYVVVASDRYDSDRDAQYLYSSHLFGPEYAGQWLDELEQTINDLTEFPGSLSMREIMMLLITSTAKSAASCITAPQSLLAKDTSEA